MELEELYDLYPKYTGKERKSTRNIEPNQKFEMLTTVYRVETKKNCAQWICQCDCGEQCKALSAELNRKGSRAKICCNKCSSNSKGELKIRTLLDNFNIKYQTVNYCKDNNIPLIRIPYTHFDNLNIEDLLLETSKFIADKM